MLFVFTDVVTVVPFTVVDVVCTFEPEHFAGLLDAILLTVTDTAAGTVI